MVETTASVCQLLFCPCNYQMCNQMLCDHHHDTLTIHSIVKKHKVVWSGFQGDQGHLTMSGRKYVCWTIAKNVSAVDLSANDCCTSG